MKTDNAALVTTGSTSTHQLTISEEQAFKIASQLISQYSSPMTPIREIIVNAMEAHEEAGVKKPVKVDFNFHEVSGKNSNLLGKSTSIKRMGGVITITDFGNGMSPEFVETKFRSLGYSTKDQSDSAVGGFGIGSKSVMAITHNAVWTTVCDGMETVIIMSHESDKFSMNITSKNTDAPSGTKVVIPVDEEKLTRIMSTMDAEFFSYCDMDALDITVNGEYHVPDDHFIGTVPYDLEPGEAGILGNFKGYNTVIILGNGNVPYVYQVDNMQHKLEKNNPSMSLRSARSGDGIYALIEGVTPVVRLNLGREHINPNREALKKSEKLDNLVLEAINNTFEKQKAELLSELGTIDNAADWREFISSISERSRKFSLAAVDNAYVSVAHSKGDDRFKMISASNGWIQIPITELFDGNILVHDVSWNHNTDFSNPKRFKIDKYCGGTSTSKFLQVFVEHGSIDGLPEINAVIDPFQSNMANAYMTHSVKEVRDCWWFPRFDCGLGEDFTLVELLEKLFNARIHRQSDFRKQFMEEGRELAKKHGTAAGNTSNKHYLIVRSIEVDNLNKIVDAEVDMCSIADVRNHFVDNKIDKSVLIDVRVSKFVNENCSPSELALDILKDMDCAGLKVALEENIIAMVCGNNVDNRLRASFRASKCAEDTPVNIMSVGYPYYGWHNHRKTLENKIDWVIKEHKNPQFKDVYKMAEDSLYVILNTIRMEKLVSIRPYLTQLIHPVCGKNFWEITIQSTANAINDEYDIKVDAKTVEEAIMCFHADKPSIGFEYRNIFNFFSYSDSEFLWMYDSRACLRSAKDIAFHVTIKDVLSATSLEEIQCYIDKVAQIMEIAQS